MPRKPDPPPAVARLRARVDRVNARLVATLQARARLVATVARAKADAGLPAADPSRERAMLRAALAGAPAGFPRRELAALLRAVFAASRRLARRAHAASRRGR